ncbi:MAG: fimbrillin family protein, partial [Bacteroidales bacterium]|nr:fimbrillin family protein [Bacteroidales bacterium]
MKKFLPYIFALCLAVSCVKENGQGGSTAVTAKGPDFEMAGTMVGKTTLSLSQDDVPTFAWKDTDVLGIIPDDDSSDQMNFKFKAPGQNPGTASFDGGSRELLDGENYIAYYPYRLLGLKSSGHVAINVRGQVQKANDSLEHLGAYDFMYAPSVRAGSGNALFEV